jgi:transposase
MAMNEINLLPRFKGRAVHDDWASYSQYEVDQALCNAHHLRTLLFLLERYPQKWMQGLSDLLVTIKAKVEAAQAKMQTALPVRQTNTFNQQFDKLVAKGLKVASPGNGDD